MIEICKTIVEIAMGICVFCFVIYVFGGLLEFVGLLIEALIDGIKDSIAWCKE
jgi:hypothetical protein